MHKKLSCTGQALMETAVIGFIFVILLLAFVDLCVLFFAKSINDDLVQRAARAGSMMADYQHAELTVKQLQRSVVPNGIITRVVLEVTSFVPPSFQGTPQTYQGQLPKSTTPSPPQLGFITVQGIMRVHFPAPVPRLGSYITIQNQSQLPITSQQAVQ